MNKMLRIKKRYLILSLLVIAALFFVNIYLFTLGKNLVLASWWLVIILLLPALIGSFFTNTFALRFFIILSFFTQFLGIPWFVLNIDRYTYTGWTAVKDFSFTLAEFYEVYLPISEFFLLVLIFWGMINIIVPLPPIHHLKVLRSQGQVNKRILSFLSLAGYKKNQTLLILIRINNLDNNS